MPYPNEHSARLKDPKDFEPKSFRRTEGGTIYGKIKIPKTIAIIWGKLKGKSKPSDPPIPQALRFPTKNWTVQKAKKWLKDNNIKYQSFEPAKKKEKQSMSQDSAPLKSCIFNDNAEVKFAKNNSEQEDNNFRIIGYSGGIIKNHWFWGNLAIDLKGLKFAKKRTPVLAEHFRDIRIGFSTMQDITDRVIVEGPFLDNGDAQKLKADMKKGFPMEASLLVPPSVVENVKEGASVEVNGHTLKGPGAVFRKSTIKEVSMCVFGADSDTESSAFADNQTVKFNLNQESNIMASETQTEIESVEMFAEQYPEFHEEIFAAGKAEGLTEGKKTERDLFASLQEACGDDHELLVKCYSEGKTTADAVKLRVQKLETEKTQLSEKVTELQNKKKPVEAARTEFTDESTPPGGTKDGKDNKNEEAWKREFSESADLQAEFGGNVDAYVAFKKADKDGRVRIAHQT
jgi:hypothetical protein